MSQDTIPILVGPTGCLAVKKFSGVHLMSQQAQKLDGCKSKWSSWELIDDMLFFSLLRQELKMIESNSRVGYKEKLDKKRAIIRRILMDEAS